MRSSRHRSSRERRCRRILDCAPDYVVVVTASGTIDYVSPVVERVLGYTPGELLGTDAFEYVHQADTEQVRDDFETKLENPGVETDVTYRVRASDGSYRWVEAQGRNYLEDPSIGGILLAVRDITDRKRKIRDLIDERDIRTALQDALASPTSISEFATTVCEELAAIDAVASAKVTLGPPEDSAETFARSSGSPQCDDSSEVEVLSVPVSYDGITRGTLYARVTASVDDCERVRELVEECAELLGHAIGDDERRRALAAERWVQFTVTVDSAASPLSRAVDEVGGPVTMTALVPHGDDEALCYLSPEKPSAFASAASETTGIEQVRRAGDERVQAVVTEPIPCNVVTSHGGTIRQAHIESTSSTVVVRFPDGEAFDPVLDALAQRFDDVGIADFTTAAADTDDDSEPLGRLTDRQREVLEVAFRSGYFEKPRPNDATAVAETLDIARPTYDEILRAAQRNLLSELFDGE